MRETGAPSTVNCDKGSSVPAPPGVLMVAPPEVLRNPGRKAKARLLRGTLALNALHLLPSLVLQNAIVYSEFRLI